MKNIDTSSVQIKKVSDAIEKFFNPNIGLSPEDATLNLILSISGTIAIILFLYSKRKDFLEDQTTYKAGLFLSGHHPLAEPNILIWVERLFLCAFAFLISSLIFNNWSLSLNINNNKLFFLSFLTYSLILISTRFPSEFSVSPIFKKRNFFILGILHGIKGEFLMAPIISYWLCRVKNLSYKSSAYFSLALEFFLGFLVNIKIIVENINVLIRCGNFSFLISMLSFFSILFFVGIIYLAMVITYSTLSSRYIWMGGVIFFLLSFLALAG